MDRLPGMSVRIVRNARRPADPFTGFARLRQKSGLLACVAALAVQALLVMAPTLTLGFAPSGPAHAQVREPIVPGVRPNPRPAPPTRITPRAPFLPAPRVEPGPRLPSAPGEVRPGVARPSTTGSGCHARCGSQCESVSCAGLTPSQCTGARQQCRLSCRSQCR